MSRGSARHISSFNHLLCFSHKDMYTLIIEDRHGRNAAEISFEQGSYNIGRVEGNDVVLPSNSVSRTHARIFVSNNKCYFDDLGSTGGSLINGVPVTQRTEITNGTKIKIGDYTLYLEYKDNANAGQGQEILKTQIVSGAQSGFKIVRVGDKFAGEEFMLSESTNTIGRAEDNYVLLSDPSVSRSHAQIVNVGMSFKVIDLNSQNGTFVNGKRVVSEQILQTGDEIGFGNLRFVFVPATQTVNLAMYAKSASDSKSVIVLLSSLLAVFIVILVTVAFIAYTSNKEDVVEEPQTAVAEEDTFEKLNELYTSAYHDFQANRYKAANEKLSKLLEKWPNESRVKDLQNRIDEELHNEEIIAKGDELFDQRLFKEAVETYKEISEKSMAYGRAQDRIADAEDKLLIVKYNDARDACEELSEECIDALCEAAVKLQENGKHEASLNEAKNFLDGITKNKKSAKFSAQAKKCLSDL